jgi:hypothetical protein
VTSAKAAACGLTYRPLAESTTDTLAWAKTRPADHKWGTALPAAREAEILEGLRA